MKLNQTRDILRLHIPNRRDLRDIGIATSAMVAAGVFTIAAGESLLADGDPVATAAPAPALDAECGGLWEQVQLSGRPEATTESAAAEVGLVSRGPWISLDGLSWEHIDGRIVVVAHPRSNPSPRDTSCASDAANAESSRA